MDRSRQGHGPAVNGATALIVGGILSAIAAVAHVAVIIGGPSWYRFFGAGEGMAELAEHGSSYPTVITLGIALILAIWAAYAFSGAGLLPRLPLLRTALVVISAIYLLRAFFFIPALALAGTPITPFAIWSSVIVLLYGAAYSIGSWMHWPMLAPSTGAGGS